MDSIIEKEIEEIKEFLECEKKWVFAALMMVGGYLGAFTYTLRGEIFCNAQTGNFVLFSMAIGKGQFKHALYYLIPMSAYLLGTIISEALPLKVKEFHFLRWDTILVAFEMLVVIILGFVPESAPYQISQIAINFICSMQYNTFRQAQRIPMATTFCTNHVRQTGVFLVKWIRHKERKENLKRSLFHLKMLCMFVIGGAISSYFCQIFLGKAIWGAAVILFVIFINLLHADLTTEKGLLDRKPSGH